MRLLLCALLSVVACLAQDPAAVVGDWQGTLKTAGPELRLALHIKRDEKGTLTATLDSVDQGANGIPIAGVTQAGRKLTLDIQAIRGTYVGELSEDGGTLAGTWTQGGQPLPLTFTKGTAAAVKDAGPDRSASVAPLLGVWEGTLEAGAMKLRARLTLRKDDLGQIRGTFDSIDQGLTGLPMTGLSLEGNRFHFDLRGVGGSYDGTVNAERASIQGTWRQQGNELPLTWRKVDKPTALNRPQEPTKPYPYREVEVTYPNAKASGVVLAGTLTLPRGAGPFPAVVLISGSGPQDRDESLMGHRPFLVLADHLTRKGVAVLRFDDRGVRESQGSFAEATTEDFATDAEAGVTFLKTRPEVNAKRIGLIGHSEGGMVAPILAARSSDVAFLVLIAAPGEPATALLQTQMRLIMRAGGSGDGEIAKSLAAQRQAFEVLRTEKDQEVAQARLRSILASAGAKPEAESASIAMMTSPWFRYLLAYDPAVVLAKVRVPVLAVNGEKDLQVESKSNLAGIRKALDQGGNRRVTLVELPGLNHLLQTAQTGAVTEYATIEETMNPAALELISEWVLKAAA